MRGVVCGLLVVAVGCATPGLRHSESEVARGAEPAPAEADHLALAADRLDKGDDAGAVPHLTAYVKASPSAVMVRAYLAELHFKLGATELAKPHFERFTRDAGGLTGTPHKHLVHCHTRLMEIATKGDDAFGEHLHRGIGLVLLVEQWDADTGTTDDVPTEKTLVQATAALKVARESNPTDPRVHLYLAEAWSRLGQHSAARAAMKVAKDLLPDPCVSEAERSRIVAGCR